MNDFAKTYRGFAYSIDEAYERVKEIVDQLAWVEPDALQLDIFIGLRDYTMIQLDGYKYQYLVKIVL